MSLLPRHLIQYFSKETDMCGFLFGYDKGGGVNDSLFVEALKKLHHRGPDNLSVKKIGFNFLGHTRLSILDTTHRADQPFTFENFSIIFNGEIYNYIEIRDLLIKKGYEFTTNSDTEVALKAFACWGKDCVEKFNGMWAIIILNHLTNEVFVSRDRFGKKPLFYHLSDRNFIIASEMKAITPFLDHVQESSDFAFCSQNVFHYESTDKTLIDGIRRFPAGSIAFWAPDKNLQITKFWSTQDHLTNVPENYHAQVSVFRELFLDSIKLRMRSDVPIGTALSGGLDSSAIFCGMNLLHQQGRVDQNTNFKNAFVACFKGTFLDEREYAQEVCDYVKVKPNLIEIDPVSSIDRLMDYLYLFEDLYITSPIPMVELYKHIKQGGVKVTLDGHGADELMCGYGRDIYKALLDCELDFNQINNIFQTMKGLVSVDSKQVVRATNLYNEFKSAFQMSFGYGRSSVKSAVKFGVRRLIGTNRSDFGTFNAYLYQIFHESILPTLLRNYDRYSMASGVEIRMPFMDHRLVTYAFSLPWQSKLNNGFTKTIIRDACRDFMPTSVVNRKTKIGFNTPVVDWIRGPWREYFEDVINSNNFKSSRFIDSSIVKARFEKVLYGDEPKFGDGESAWVGISPYLWEQSFLKRVSHE